MFINIIAKIVDDKQKDLGYILLDTDDNNKTITVSKEQLVQVLKNKRLKVENAKLVGESIVGKYYSLNILPFVRNNIFYNNIEYICLKNEDYALYTLVSVKPYGADVIKVGLSRLIKLPIKNVSQDGAILCKTICKREDKTDIKKGITKLDKEVLDKNILWSIDDFVEYMDDHNYAYNLARDNDGTYTLNFIDKQCINIKIPCGIVRVGCLYDKVPSEINSIILNPDIKYFSKLGNFELSQENSVIINNLQFQNREDCIDRMLDCSALENVTVRNIIDMPHRHRINNFGDRCYFNGINFGNHIRKLSSSFHNCKFNNPKLHINIESIESSFANLANISSIYFGDKVNDIWMSFDDIKLTELNFSKANNLKLIRRSFDHLENVREIDFSNTVLTTLNNSVHHCEKLVSIKLPDTIKDMSGDTLYKCNIKTLELPESLNVFPIRAQVTDEIIYPSSVKTLSTNNLIDSYSTKPKFTFKNKLKYIARKTFEGSTLCNDGIEKLDIDLSQCILQDGAFEAVWMEQFDSRTFPSTQSIPEDCFRNSHIVNFIFGDNIKEIEANALRDCKYAKKIIIGNSVEKIVPNAFSLMHSSFTTIYVIKGSYAHKFFSKRNNVIVVCASFEDALYEAFAGVETEERKIGKFRMILQGTKYEVLLDDKYINNVSYLYNLWYRIDTDNYVNKPLVLNTTKFKELDITLLPFLTHMLSLRNNKDLPQVVGGELKNQFISMCNLITTLTDNNEILYRLAENNSSYNLTDCNYSYIDSRCMIGTCSIDVIGTNISILMIVIDDKIVYMTPFDYSFISKNHASNHMHNFISGGVRIPSINFTLTDEFIQGDTLSSGAVRIKGTEIPNQLGGQIMGSLGFNYKFIGLLDTSLRSRNKMLNTLYFDTCTEKFLELSSENDFTSYGSKHIIAKLYGFSVKNIYGLSDISKLSVDYFSTFKDAIENVENINAINLALASKNEIDNMFSDENFDISDNKNVTEFADAVYKYSVTNANCLTLPIAELLLQSEYFVKSDISMKKCIKYEYEPTLLRLKNSDKMLIEYKVDYRTYLIGIIDSNTSMTSKSVLSQSTMSINKLLEMYYTIGEARALGKYNKINKIINSTINVDAFFFTDVFLQIRKCSAYILKVHLAIEKMTGYTYLIADLSDTDFYTVFRFKNYMQAVQFTNNVRAESYKTSMLNKLVSNLTGVYEYNNTDYSDIRDKIMGGLPNNYPYHWGEKELFDILAKQQGNN